MNTTIKHYQLSTKAINLTFILCSDLEKVKVNIQTKSYFVSSRIAKPMFILTTIMPKQNV